MKIIEWLAPITVIGIIAGCASNIDALKPVATEAASKPYADRSISQRRSFRGFTVIPPKSDGWVITRKDRNGIYLQKISGPHQRISLLAFAELKLLQTPLNSTARLKEFVEKMEKLGESDRRFKNYLYNISTIRINGKDCVKTDFSSEDYGVPYDRRTPYILKGFTTYCLHPDSSSRVVVVSYSQRYEKGKAPLTLENEMQQFVEGIVFERLGE